MRCEFLVLPESFTFLAIFHKKTLIYSSFKSVINTDSKPFINIRRPDKLSLNRITAIGWPLLMWQLQITGNFKLKTLDRDLGYLSSTVNLATDFLWDFEQATYDMLQCYHLKWRKSESFATSTIWDLLLQIWDQMQTKHLKL